MKKTILLALCCLFALSMYSEQMFYVSPAGSNRADGSTPQTAKKDLQAMLNYLRDQDINGATIRIAEGNYLGSLDAGYIEIYNWVTLQGGWNSSFTERNPLKYLTRIEPTEKQRETNSAKALIQVNKALDDVQATRPKGSLFIDGLCLNLGFENTYQPDGQLADMTPPQINHALFHSDGWIAGHVYIRNCVFANGPYFAIQFGSRCGKVVISNNVFVSNRYAAVRVESGGKTGKSAHVIFHHNTIAFTWCRDKAMEDMGYGYECMTKMDCDIKYNIFACNNNAAISRTHVLSGPDKAIEAKRVTDIHHNAFFMNPADLQLPPTGGGKWTNVKAAQFEDLDATIIPKAEGNVELSKNDPFVKALDPKFLKAFSELKVVRNSTYDGNSKDNRVREALGTNQKGYETIRTSFYGNRYSLEKAILLFGINLEYGAQIPQ